MLRVGVNGRRAFLGALWASFSYGAVAFQSPVQWQTEYSKPCVCDANLRTAIPQMTTNRTLPKQRGTLLPSVLNLIEGFTADSSIPNSEKLILWSIYELGAYDIAHALVRAEKAGVEVRVVTDGKSVMVPPNDSGRDAGRGALTRDVLSYFIRSGVMVVYSKPEWKPISSLFPPQMHEKVRIFARKSKDGKSVTPLVGYVSTHNDTYSELVGDPVAGLSMDRLRQGGLKDEEIVPTSFGNVQTAFVVRNAALLRSLTQNHLEQEKVYGRGQGRIIQVARQTPLLVHLKDGASIRLSYTYAKRDEFNPNLFQEEFILQNKQGLEMAFLQEFVFTHTATAEALKKVAEDHPASIHVAVDGSQALEPWTQARSMAGLYSVRHYIPSMPIGFPWRKDIRKNVTVQVYTNPQDKLHTKNAWYVYSDAFQKRRYRIYTGSANLSSNAGSNKEVAFEIDTADEGFLQPFVEQWNFLQNEGNLYHLATEALYYRVASAAGGKKAFDLSQPESRSAFSKFLGELTGATERRQMQMFPGAFSVLDQKQPQFFATESDVAVEMLSGFYAQVGAVESGHPVVEDLRSNLAATRRFRATVPNIELMLVLSDRAEHLDAKMRQSVLDLFN